MTMLVCKSCDRQDPRDRPNGQWWHCSGYFKISGTFCPECYDKISHDSYQRPNRPADYLMMLLKFGIAQK